MPCRVWRGLKGRVGHRSVLGEMAGDQPRGSLREGGLGRGVRRGCPGPLAPWMPTHSLAGLASTLQTGVATRVLWAPRSVPRPSACHRHGLVEPDANARLCNPLCPARRAAPPTTHPGRETPGASKHLPDAVL